MNQIKINPRFLPSPLRISGIYLWSEKSNPVTELNCNLNKELAINDVCEILQFEKTGIKPSMNDLVLIHGSMALVYSL